MAVECTYCEEKVNANRGIYIKCSTCQDVKLCLECFSAGATISDHQSDHPYELVDCGSFAIIDESWKAFEELALLEAIELYGIGSWTDIANAVETRSAEECRERYLRVYVENFFGRCSWNTIQKDLYVAQDHTCAHNQPLSPSLSLPEESKIVDIPKDRQVRLGYMPKRDDFEREYDNDAELLVSKLAVNANDDTDLDQELKIAHINMYTDKLRERFRRKRIVLEYNLVKLFFHMHPEENSNLEDAQQDPESEVTAAGRASIDIPINSSLSKNQIPSATDGDTDTSPTSNHQSSTATATVNPTLAAPNGKTHPHPRPIPQNTILNYFRRIEHPSTTPNKNAPNSSSSPPENSILSSYFSDLNKTIAEQDFNTMEKKLRIFCQFSTADDHNNLIRNLAREKELKMKIKDLMRKRKSGKTKLSSSVANSQESDTSCKQSPSKKNSIKSSAQANNNSVDELMDVDTEETNPLSPTKVTPKKNARSDPTKAIINSHQNQNSPEPSWRLLSESEKRLCKSTNLKPSQYISFKAFIIKEHNQKKKKGVAQRLYSDDIDKTVKRRIVDFLTRNNWIKV